MQAIKTKYLPATNFLGARIKASAEMGSVTVPYPYEASESEKVHFNAVIALFIRFKLDWSRSKEYRGIFQAGWHKDAYYWVIVPEKTETSMEVAR